MNININISATPEMLGQRAATMIAQYIRQAIEEKGCARIIISTGASQFEPLAALVKEDLEWTKVEMFHLDEYVGLSERHIASFRKYLKERFVNEIAKNPRGPLKTAHFVNGEGWFKGIDDVPTQAITMCPNQIMSCKHIVTCVPHAVKAEAIFNTITQAVTPEIPATLLKTHPDWNLFVDNASAAKLLGN